MGPRSNSVYHLSRHAADLAAVETAFPDHLKLRSICWLMRVGARSTEGLVLQDASEPTLRAAINYGQSRQWPKFMLRHDSPAGQAKTVQGGFLLEFDEIHHWVSYFTRDGICMLLEPFDALRNGYNVSCLIDSNSTLIEIVGPGFDASDLQRGQAPPHEVRTVDFVAEKFGQPTLITDSSYTQSVFERERKIWWKFHTRELDRTRWRNLSEIEIEKCRALIAAVRGAPIPTAYKPVSRGSLRQYVRAARPIVEAWRNQFGGPAVLAASYVQSGELVFWDVSTSARWLV